ncbi:immunoglobulin domain-containing protein [Thiolapillus sp.]|uniref:immunoglobulin domain-containing protein n=5 Tax=Thiolapillus sp. TaxID=2017437 RepID=UPI0034D395C4
MGDDRLPSLFVYVSVKPQTPTVSGTSSLTDGDTASLTCTTASSLTTGVTYEWLLAGTAISGATSSPYTTAVTMSDDGNAYTCKVTFNGVTSDVSSNAVTLSGEEKRLIEAVGGVRVN